VQTVRLPMARLTLFRFVASPDGKLGSIVITDHHGERTGAVGDFLWGNSTFSVNTYVLVRRCHPHVPCLCASYLRVICRRMYELCTISLLPPFSGASMNTTSNPARRTHALQKCLQARLSAPHTLLGRS
jgi:hypothetical protein